MSVRSLRPPYAADSCCPGSLPGRPGEPCPAGQRRRNTSSILRASNRSEKRPLPPSGTRSRSGLPALFPGAVLILAEALSPGSGADPQSAPGLTAAFPWFPAAPRPWERDQRGCFPSVLGAGMNLPRNTCSFLSVPIANARNTWYLFSMKVSAPFMRIVYSESCGLLCAIAPHCRWASASMEHFMRRMEG